MHTALRYRAMLEKGIPMRLTVCATLLLLGVWIPAALAEEVTIPARELSARSDNIAAEYAQFDNLTLCVGQGGRV